MVVVRSEHKLEHINTTVITVLLQRLTVPEFVRHMTSEPRPYIPSNNEERALNVRPYTRIETIK